MDLDDIFGDEAVKKARPGGKFQPKAKPRPVKKGPAVTTNTSSQVAQTSGNAETKLAEPLGTEKPSGSDDQRNSESTGISSEKVVVEDNINTRDNTYQVSEARPDGDGGWRSSLGKSPGDNIEIFIELESLDRSPPDTTTDMEYSVTPSKTAAENTSNVEPDGAFPSSGLPQVDDSTYMFNEAETSVHPESEATQDPLTDGELLISTIKGGGFIDNREFETEEPEAVDDLDFSELTTRSVQSTGKFLPKQKMQIQKKMSEARKSSTDAGDSFPCSQDEQSVSKETDFVDKTLVSGFPQDDNVESSSVRISPSEPPESISVHGLNEELIDIRATSQVDSEMPQSNLEEPTVASDPSSDKQTASTSGQKNGLRRSSRPRKKKTNASQITDEAEDNFENEAARTDTENVQQENESQPKKVKRKAKSVCDEEKPTRKRKKATEASEEPAKEKPKKFSHSTRSKRRQVDKVLLETPEDEIDYRKVPIRDLILLADHKERELKKIGRTTQGTSTNQSETNLENHYDEAEAYGSEDNGEYGNGEENDAIKDTSVFFNYHSYMDRTPTTRWSKQDTELFYEAVQQFGTDLSMIQLLFPGRTRRQVKLKYKKEERQHPLRLREALTTRAKDNSHFQTVIERLQQIAAENEEANKDEAVDLRGNEDEKTQEEPPAADEEETKFEHIEKEGNTDVAQDPDEHHSPTKSDHDEEDEFDWSLYKSDL